MRYRAGYSLPNMVPYETDCFNDALAFILEEMEYEAENTWDMDENVAHNLRCQIEDLSEVTEPFSILGADGWIYFVDEG